MSFTSFKEEWLERSVSTESSDFTAARNRTYLVDNSSSSITVTLPNPQLGDMIKLKHTGASLATNTVTVDGNGANVDGAASYSVKSLYQALTLVSDGTNWFII